MKADVSIKRVAAFAKRLLQVALQSPGPFAAGTLFLLSEVLKVRLPAAGPPLVHVTLHTTTSHACNTTATCFAAWSEHSRQL